MNWGRHLTCILVVAGGAHQRLLGRVDKVVGQREVCWAVGTAPHLPAAGVAVVPSFDEEVLFDILHLDDVIALPEVLPPGSGLLGEPP